MAIDVLVSHLVAGAWPRTISTAHSARMTC